jgi:CheY-like chemotaxis protein
MKKAQSVFRILIVEDDPVRIEILQSWLPENTTSVSATSTRRAIGVLERDRGRVYAGILLDYDLEKQAATDADTALSGSHIVDAIIRNVSTDTAVLIHSVNATQAHAMAVKLEKAGYWVTRIPMSGACLTTSMTSGTPRLKVG